jgi:hypothetical protein
MLKNKWEALAWRKSEVIHLHISKICGEEKESKSKVDFKRFSGIENTRRKIITFEKIIKFVSLPIIINSLWR